VSSDLSIEEARRVALAAQRLDQPRPAGPITECQLHALVRRLGLVQIDYVNVLVPAHYLVPFSRLGPYDRAGLDRLIFQRRVLAEQWAHEASIVPVESWALLRQRPGRTDQRAKAFAAFLARESEYARTVLEAVRERGPLAPADMEGAAKERPKRKWWNWSLAKRTFEAHFATGMFAIAGRGADFSRLYDLVERVVPAEHHGRSLDPDQAYRELVRLAARAHGVATIDDIANYYQLPMRETRQIVADLIAEGELRAVRVEGWKQAAVLHKEAAVPRRIEAATLLSPFDPVMWYRPRVSRLFGFEYRIEIFVPKPKRVWGYYVLPFLFGDRLAARVDLKADRPARRLMVLASHLEPHADTSAVASALAAELRTMAAWLGLDGVSVARRGNFARALARAVRDQRT
jgi:uncharacterized protein YcaQ